MWKEAFGVVFLMCLEELSCHCSGWQDPDLNKGLTMYSEPGSVVGIATAYGLDGPGIETQWGEIFRTAPDRL